MNRDQNLEFVLIGNIWGLHYRTSLLQESQTPKCLAAFRYSPVDFPAGLHPSRDGGAGNLDNHTGSNGLEKDRSFPWPVGRMRQFMVYLSVYDTFLSSCWVAVGRNLASKSRICDGRDPAFGSMYETSSKPNHLEGSQ